LLRSNASGYPADYERSGEMKSQVIIKLTPNQIKQLLPLKKKIEKEAGNGKIGCEAQIYWVGTVLRIDLKPINLK